MIDARFVYLERPAKLPVEKDRFGSKYGQTLSLLERELRCLDAVSIVIQAGYRQVRNDGWPYSSAKADHPACTLQFISRRRPLAFQGWQYSSFEANLRAIALTLEALRAVERYGVVSGQQYEGFRRLEAPAPADPAAAAREFFARHAPGMGIHEAYRALRRRFHPDTLCTGSHELFIEARKAYEALTQ